MELFITIFCVLALLTVAIKNKSETSSKSSVTTLATNKAEEVDTTWKTYVSKGEYSFTINYPAGWHIVDNFGKDNRLVYLSDSADRKTLKQQVTVECPFRENESSLFSPKDWEGNEGGYFTSYLEDYKGEKYNGIKYIWSSPDYSFNELCTAFWFDEHNISCQVCTAPDKRQAFTKEYVDNLDLYNQILSSTV